MGVESIQIVYVKWMMRDDQPDCIIIEMFSSANFVFDWPNIDDNYISFNQPGKYIY